MVMFFENSEGQVIFRYNLAWGRVGAACNAKIRAAGTRLEEIETIIPQARIALATD
ncbi:MAG: hypothetical protein HS126_24735 [Anaerolineales bacterium]|nr:hypothetical protein [Anaerolineales bacterium]